MSGISGLCSNRVVKLCSVRFFSSKSSKKLLQFLADMPKMNSDRIVAAQRQRQNISRKSEKYAPSTVYLQVIGSGARGCPNTLYLFTDQKRYLFNCGECTQRLAHEHKVKLSKLDHIFITSKTWRNIGGLPGLSLTLQDVGVPNITLHGPEGLDELYTATERFVIMKDMNVRMAKCNPSSKDFEDSALTVKYILLGPHDNLLSYEESVPKRPKFDNIDKELEKFIYDDTDYYKSSARNLEHTTARKEKLSLKMRDKESEKAEKLLLKAERVLHNLAKRSGCTVAFVCTLKKRMGTLDLAKCVEMGVKPGPLLGQLKNGHDVVLPDGTLVLSKDVKTPDDPGPVFIVMEVPDITYLKEVEFASHFDNATNPPENIPVVVAHYTPPHVFNDPTYQAFMAKFGPTTRHLVLNSQNSCLGSEAVHRTQHKLNLLDSEIFPLLKDASIPAVWNSSPTRNEDSQTRRGLEELKNKIAVAQFQNIINMEGSKGDGQTSREENDALQVVTPRTLTMVHLRPNKQVDRAAEPKLHIQDYIQETMDVDGFVSSLEHFKRVVENMRYARVGSQHEYPKVVFLGTGSCIPSKTRNTSSIVLQISETQSMIMDCGEGTFGQLVRFYGPKKVNSFLRTLTAIYISHLHADHHIGLIGLLQARREAFLETAQRFEPLHLLAPGQIITWLSTYDHQFERLMADFTLIPNQNLMSPKEIPDPATSSEQVYHHDMTPAILAQIGIQNIKTCLVNHCPNAFGVTIEIDGTNKLTYSGDTIPSDDLIQLGQNSTLLIHEATMEDELADEARMKMHSTTGQAIEVGRQMGAKYTLLTHFSQRYARLPRLNAHILHDNNTVGIAFDNMQISMHDLELLPHMYAPLQLMFAEHCVEMEMKAISRARHKKRAYSPNSGPKPRWVSPECRVVASAPARHANYRETNASRLRQEIKGMAITGYLKKGVRSSSSSPSKNKSGNSSPTRSLNDDPTSLMRKDSERTIDLMPPSYPISETSMSSKGTQDKFKKGVEQPGKTCAIRTTSDTLHSCRETQDKWRMSTGQSRYTCENRPKPLNTTTEFTSEKIINVQNYKPVFKDLPNAAHINPVTNSKVPSSILSSNCKGYGKPLVTHLNKKLSIRRDHSSQNIKPAAKDSNHTRVKPSISPPSTPVTFKQPGPKLVSKLPVKTNPVTNRAPFNTSPKLTDYLPKHQLPTKETPSTSAYSANGIPNVLKTKPIDVRSRGHDNAKPQRPMSALMNRCEQSKERSACKPRDVKSATNRNKPKLVQPKQDTKDQFPVEAPKMSHLRSSLTRIPMKIHSENSIKQRKCSTEKLKEQFCRDTPVYTTGRPNSTNQNARTFKPQLEDIKSSYLLLNKKELEHEKKMRTTAKVLADRVEENILINEPIYDESRRKGQLQKIKQKFKSRSFYDDSRFDKIEGLNWISWKD